MKKLVIIITAMTAFVLVASITANAQQKTVKAEKSVQTSQSGFVDANSDGICDNYDGTRPGKGLGPGNGNGEGRATGQRLGRQQGLRDGSGQGQRKLDGTGQRRGNKMGLRNGSGPNCTITPKQ